MDPEKTQCQICGTYNSPNQFWCKNCDATLNHNLNKAIEPEEKGTNDILFKISTQTPYKKKKSQSLFKGTVGGILIALLLFTCLLVLLNGSSVSLFNQSLNPINCKVNDDFWFNGTQLYTDDGWVFDITKVKEYTLEGVVLGLKTYSRLDYPFRPINIFSPIDLLIGVNDVADNPEKYPIQITSYSDRIVFWSWRGSDWGNYEYLKSHSGNNHIIPQSTEVLNILKNNITINSRIILDGCLVNLYGTNGNQHYTWTTDTQIGNHNCEVILVENITIL
jgi:hypothetical protein